MNVTVRVNGPKNPPFHLPHVIGVIGLCPYAHASEERPALGIFKGRTKWQLVISVLVIISKSINDKNGSSVLMAFHSRHRYHYPLFLDG